ncbi:MAG: transcriptional repressor [Acidihalobacter sp.]|uniref:Fur family transcriptional regulator n=1 Tax=Acidihalobacter sp. TaxID=1872108 RepID=UPI00307D14C6
MTEPHDPIPDGDQGTKCDASCARILAQAERICAERSVRLTPQRRAVLELLLASDRPLTAYVILDQLRKSGFKPAPPMVYRALDFLMQQGLIHKLESMHAYLGCEHPNHPHESQFLVCSECGDVREMERRDVVESLRSAEAALGFKTDRAVVELLGTCAQCAHRDSSA